jgi:mannosyl-3-phosphoglycerate phosphatase
MNHTKKQPQILIFSDLDGTLLDHFSCSFDAAHEALQKINSVKIPLIICSSKTRVEVERWRNNLNNQSPFITENGGGIFFPLNGKAPAGEFVIEKDGYKIVALGMPYPELLVGFKKLKNLFGKKIKGFSEMKGSEISQLTGLSLTDAELARQREYTEPFIFDGDDEALRRLQKEVKILKLNLTRGDRFFHLLGKNDKGKAVRIVTGIYKKRFPQLRTIGIGDSYNDLPMLKMVDIPILVQKPGGIFDENIKDFPHLIRTPGIGPEGWNTALLGVLV